MVLGGGIGGQRDHIANGEARKGEGVVRILLGEVRKLVESVSKWVERQRKSG